MDVVFVSDKFSTLIKAFWKPRAFWPSNYIFRDYPEKWFEMWIRDLSTRVFIAALQQKEEIHLNIQ